MERLLLCVSAKLTLFLSAASFGIRLLPKRWLSVIEIRKRPPCAKNCEQLGRKKKKKKHDQEYRLLDQLPKIKKQMWRKQRFDNQLLHSSRNPSKSMYILQKPHSIVTHTLSNGCADSTTTTGKEAHSKGSYDSAFGFSVRPPVHLWGTWDSSASTTSLISTCQAASCCGWIQGMSGAMSRSHLKWQDEKEGQGLAYGAD